MIYITQLIYLIKGQEQVFEEFENLAIPLISKYNGKLLLRVRPAEDSFIQYMQEKPYEIHFVEFASQADFDNFMQDEARKHFLHLKQQSVQSSVIVTGTKL
jgi:uncharacterized protein (DUF1330 family)